MKPTNITRWILGAIYFVFGLNFFLHFLPMPPMPEEAQKFMGALFQSGYFFPVLKVTEVLGGLLLLSGFFAPLALVILMPITVQIVFFHACLTPGAQNLVLPLVMLVLHLVSATGYRAVYSPLLKIKS